MSNIEYIIVGLGNPGKQYETTRHNAGFLAVDFIANKLGIKINKVKFQSIVGDGTISNKRVLFIKPSTYMNLSGEAVREAMNFYKIPAEKVVVIFDDSALPIGGLRIRRSGSDGGQKGIRSVIACNSSDAFPRIKVGIGQKPYPEMDMADWVLSKFAKDDIKALENIFPDILDALQTIISGDIETAMNRYNVRGQGQ